MRRQEIVLGFGVLSLLLLLIVGCGGGGNGGGGGGNGGGGTGVPVTATITGAVFVAVQDGKTGTWRRLTGSGPNYNFTVTAADRHYSIAWVCGGTKPQVNIVHTTTAETTSIAATCPSAPSTITVSGSVQGLSSGQRALVAISSAAQTVAVNGGTFNIPILPGSHDIIAVRSGNAGPNRVWLRRNASFNNNTSGLLIDFNQLDSPSVRVFDVSAGTLTITDASPDETIDGQVALQSSGRSLLIGLGSGLGQARLEYPIIPRDKLAVGENFRIQASDLRRFRGEVRALDSLPGSLNITLPDPFELLSFSFTSTGELTFTVQWSAYAESPVRGYLLTLGGDQQQREWRIIISAGWLGNARQYTTPVLNTLSGWDSAAWDIQRGRPVDARFTVWVSPSSMQQLLDYQRTGIAPAGFRLRFATRSANLTP